MDLSDAEIRVLGCLLEKQRTTPDHYPLSLNSLRLACNQSTNRDPVVEYDEAVIRDALHRLGRRGYARLAGASRAAKYRHLLSEVLPMSDAEQAIMCVLMLRGAQTPGELKQRGERIHSFAELEEVQETLAALIGRELVRELLRRPGQKEERYLQLLGGGDSTGESTATPAPREIVGEGGPSTMSAQHASVPDEHAPVPDKHAPAQHAPAQQASAQHAPASHAPAPQDLRLTERVVRLEQEVSELRAALSELRAERDDSPQVGDERSQDSVVPQQDSAASPQDGVAPQQDSVAQPRSEVERRQADRETVREQASVPQEPAGAESSWGGGVAQPTP
jgi:uncharacterized protein YceH (UPF0502 family)